MKDVVKSIVSKIERLKPMPQVVSKAFSMLKSGDYNVDEVEKLISLDPSITADLLRMANSSYYSFKTKINTVGRALVVLGSKVVLDMLVALYASPYFKKGAPGYLVSGEELWKHALMVAIASEKLSKALGVESDVAYTAGLLHDIGKTILGEFLKERVNEVLDLVKTERVSFIEAERRVFGVSHQEVGAMAAEHWKFPEELVFAIRYHHEPGKAPGHRKLISIVHVANNLVLSSGLGSGTNGLAYEMDNAALEELGLSVMDSKLVDSVYLELAERLKSLAEP